MTVSPPRVSDAVVETVAKTDEMPEASKVTPLWVASPRVTLNVPAEPRPAEAVPLI